MASFDRTLVTAALPYANGPIHLGHLAGVYVPADIYVRFLRQQGLDVTYVRNIFKYYVTYKLMQEEAAIEERLAAGAS